MGWVGLVHLGRGLWLGWAPTFSHPLGIGGGAIVAMGAGHWGPHPTGFYCSRLLHIVWKIRVVWRADVA